MLGSFSYATLEQCQGALNRIANILGKQKGNKAPRQLKTVTSTQSHLGPNRVSLFLILLQVHLPKAMLIAEPLLTTICPVLPSMLWHLGPYKPSVLIPSPRYRQLRSRLFLWSSLTVYFFSETNTSMRPHTPQKLDCPKLRMGTVTPMQLQVL